ncbi:hypothetical protein [Spirosoma sordidisoli]|uniref:Uncharacterized protein n=1 Tax=Spirosoma sordidisoli TaxID=2502893 RepID=A0A4Q2UFG9_9BACT|nr:hypothetical protein [Spirosoma sordidisoli]RYC68007.1 hypothetical protein EQG79_21365 [Spirosoma sordidisoli]
MTQHQEQLAALQEIRSLMERSSSFTSLSGFSGIVVGLLALVGLGVVYGIMNQQHVSYSAVCQGQLPAATGQLLMLTALATLVLALGSVVFFSWLKAQKAGQSIWQEPGQRVFGNLFIPLIAGGVFCGVLLYHQIPYLVAPAMLIFYGLALINSSKYTFIDIHYLGLGQIALGLLASFQVEYGLLAWGAGFGGLNILYGTLMYDKYEKDR